jgi:predicted PhzF superfamily epimerase YddE/YHI9
MFMPAAGVPEDPVCGTAHCLLTPYWSARIPGLQARLRSAEGINARQVSQRVGELGIRLDDATGIIRLAGEVVAIATGQINV